MAKAASLHRSIFITMILMSFHSSLSQTPSQPSNTCDGIFLSYTYTGGYPIPPTLSTNQPHRFQSTLTILNNGPDDLKSWRVFVGFQHNELLVSATNAVVPGTSLPAHVGNGTLLAGFPATDLKSAIQTAGDVNQMLARVDLVGTQFGVGAPNVPMPANLTLANDGYLCSNPIMQGNNETHLCCRKDPTFRSSISVEEFLPRRDGDLVITYDVIRSYDTNYWAQVTISNHNPLGRIDNWRLSWDWMRDEFIYAMKGAYPDLIDTSQCIFGSQGQYYQDFDFSVVLSCEKSPTIIDLPPTRANDTNLGMIPFCCRNGTLLPPSMDPSKSTSIFLMQVFKMPPDLNRTEIIPPENWKITGTGSPDYQCDSPVRVRPTLFPDPSGLSSQSTAIASWQVICNITRPKDTKPRCCVSFSAFFNESVVPCTTCACGCNNPSQTCSTTEPALLLLPKTQLIPFDNRTSEAVEWARMKDRTVPDPLPCGDNCGVSINWHLNSDYRDGWTARMTLLNWGETEFVDWFATVQFDKAVPGFEGVYSFNGSVLSGSNNTIFMQGFSGLNYLLAEKDGKNPQRDPRVPGMQQSVISFTKKKTPGIDVARRDGFPSKVFFNGEECALPLSLPSSAQKLSSFASVFGLLALLALSLMQ